MKHHPHRFKDKVAVVTGSAQGIGKMVAVHLAREGGRVALVDRSEIVNETRGMALRSSPISNDTMTATE